MHTNMKAFILFFLALLSCNVFAKVSSQGEVDTVMQPFKQEWAEIKYVVPDNQKVSRLQNLIKRLDVVVDKYPNRAEPLVWRGTMQSTMASLKGGLSALSMAKKAKKDLELALVRDPTSEKGYAHVILGALYAKVPSKPIGFGDKAKAKRHFQTALQMDPDGLDANYFYGEFLMDQGEFVAAKKYLEVAQKSPVNVDNHVFEAGRRAEVAKVISAVEQKAIA